MNNNQNPVDPQVNQNINMQNSQNGINTNPYINTMNTPASTTGIQSNPYINNQVGNGIANNMGVQNTNNDSILNGDFVKGALIGAGVAFLLTNKTTQGAIMNGFSKGSELVQAGIEELKERMEDAKAQMEARES